MFQLCRFFIFLLAALLCPGAVLNAAPAPLPQHPDKVPIQLQTMTLEEKVGQLFIIAPDGNIEELIRNYHVGGVVLFGRHAPNLRQTMELIEKVRLSSGSIPPLVAVDQEGGRVARLKFAASVPPARTLAVLNAHAVKEIGCLTGEELAALGFNVNFAPVMDVDTDPANPVIGDRAFGSDPATVSVLGSAYIAGLHEAGIAGTAKHFPGHGDTRSDSHYQLPVVNQSRERLETVELAPFRAAIAAGVDLIMTAHVYYPALDPAPGPATFSSRILTSLLRDEAHYDGIVITDAMNMKAVTDSHSAGSAAVGAFMAGADIILMPDDLDAAYQAILSAIHSQEISLNRLDASVQRILTLKEKLMKNKDREESFAVRLQLAENRVGSQEHAARMRSLLNQP